MSRCQKDPLRALRTAERAELTRLSRSQSAPAAWVARAAALLAVADGQSYLAAARQAGRRDNDTVAAWVARFNREGLPAVRPRPGGRPSIRYGAVAQQRILAEARRPPDRERDGTATWSLSTLQRALRRAADGLPTVSTHTIWQTLHGAGLSWQQSRTWCEAWSCASASAAARWWSAIPMRWGKNADRAGVHAGRHARPGGLV